MSPWVSLVSILSLILFLAFTINVSRTRGKFGVKLPDICTAPEFERVVRVQQNTLEQMVLFLPAVWIFATFANPIAAAIIGAIWIIGRILYAWGYYQSADKRGLGFAINSLALLVLLVGSLIGVAIQLLKPIS
jgi:glutathione S-transferase